MMKNKEMRKENVLLWPLFCAYFFCFRFCRKTHAWIPRKYYVLSNCFKIKQLQLSLEEKSTFFAAPEVMTEFSAAWCLSIVSQGKQYNFASLRIVEGSAGAVVAASEIKAVELDLFSTSNCFSSCFLHAPVGDPFYERYNPFNNMDTLSETDVIQTESPENFVVIFEILPTDKEWKSNKITSCRC